MKKSTIGGIIALLLAGIITVTAGIGSAVNGRWFQNGDLQTWFNSWGQGQKDDAEKNEAGIGGGALITDTIESGGISLMSTTIDPSEYEDYGVSAAAATAYQITASVTPTDSTITDFTWSVAWKNASSTWASGKTVTDYVQISSSGNTATVSNTEAFGEPVQVTCSYFFDSSVTASCQVDYLSSLINVRGNALGDTFDDPDTYYPVGISYEFGVGTVQGEVVGGDYEILISTEAIKYMQSNAYWLYFKNALLSNYNINVQFSGNQFGAYNVGEEFDIRFFSTGFLHGNGFSSSGEAYKNYSRYYIAAFIQMCENTSSNLRTSYNYMYEYNGETIIDDYVYTPWINTSTCLTSSLLSVSGVSLNNSNLVFGYGL